eukprot:jgi/Botrbrau1/9939/Bobra.0012s0036.1
MATRASLARGKGESTTFTGYVRKWKKRKVTTDASRISILRWTATDERVEECKGPRCSEFTPVRNPNQRAPVAYGSDTTPSKKAKTKGSHAADAQQGELVVVEGGEGGANSLRGSEDPSSEQLPSEQQSELPSASKVSTPMEEDLDADAQLSGGAHPADQATAGGVGEPSSTPAAAGPGPVPMDADLSRPSTSCLDAGPAATPTHRVEAPEGPSGGASGDPGTAGTPEIDICNPEPPVRLA